MPTRYHRVDPVRIPAWRNRRSRFDGAVGTKNRRRRYSWTGRGHPLIRIDASQPYSPENCRFVSRARASQARANPSRGAPPSILVTAFGETKSAMEWALDPRRSVTEAGFRRRLARGWHPEDAVARPPVKGGYNIDWNWMVTAFGEQKSFAQWIADPRCRVSGSGLAYRLEHGASAEDAITTPAHEWRDDLESREP